jgi:flagellar basal-body rod modification protein FlgD
MTTSSVGASRAATTSAESLGAPTAQSGSTTFDSQSFMRLLIAQIQHQDPLQPMDTTQMTQQLTQLTQVERLVSIDGQLQSLSIATASVANAQASDLVGRTVEADTSHVMLTDGAPGEGAFHLPRAAAHTSVEIRDAHGQVVRTIDAGAQAAGEATFTWDGHNDSGERCPAGSYSIAVHATDAAGNAVDATTRLSGTVSSITYENGYPELTIDGVHVMLGDVRSVGGPGSATTGTAAGASATGSAPLSAAALPVVGGAAGALRAALP